jgi:hypothetical protein
VVAKECIYAEEDEEEKASGSKQQSRKSKLT